MDIATANKQLRSKLIRCEKAVMRNAPFEELVSLLDKISQLYEDRILKAEIRRLKLASKQVTQVKQESVRRRYLEQLVGFADGLPSAVRAAQLRMKRVNAAGIVAAP